MQAQGEKLARHQNRPGEGRPGFVGRVRRSMFGIKPRETNFEHRGIQVPVPRVRERLEHVVGAFVDGYHAAVSWGEPEAMAQALAGIKPELLGFAVEGSAMGFAILDLVTPWRRDRLARLLAGYGADHLYLALCGAGWALARLKRPVTPMLSKLQNETMRWLVVDGYGFHEGFFHAKRTITEHALPKHVSGYAARAFDHGLGRSLWFSCGATPERLASTIGSFAAERQGDLWSGVGLACAYAGGVDEATLMEVKRVAGAHAAALAQGAAFAAKARGRAHNPAAQTDLACRVLGGHSAADTVALVDRLGEGMPVEGAVSGEPAATPAYEVWRVRIQEAFSQFDHQNGQANMQENRV